MSRSDSDTRIKRWIGLLSICLLILVFLLMLLRENADFAQHERLSPKTQAFNPPNAPTRPHTVWAMEQTPSGAWTFRAVNSPSTATEPIKSTELTDQVTAQPTISVSSTAQPVSPIDKMVPETLPDQVIDTPVQAESPKREVIASTISIGSQTKKIQDDEDASLSYPRQEPKKVEAKAMGWGVQVGSFAEKNSAEYLVKRLRTEGFGAYTQPIEAHGKVLYKVWVSGGQERNKAEAVKTRLLTNYHLSGFIVRGSQ